MGWLKVCFTVWQSCHPWILGRFFNSQLSIYFNRVCLPHQDTTVSVDGCQDNWPLSYAHLFPLAPLLADLSFQDMGKLPSWKSPRVGCQSSIHHFQSCISLWVRQNHYQMSGDRGKHFLTIHQSQMSTFKLNLLTTFLVK